MLPAAWLAASLSALAPVLALPAHAGGGTDLVRRALAVACEEPVPEPSRMADDIAGAQAGPAEPLLARGIEVGWRRRFTLSSGASIRIERLAPGGPLRRLTVTYWTPGPGGTLRPELAAVAGADCAIRLGRRLVYEPGSPQAAAVEHLDAALAPTGEREPLNPPVPASADPGGVAVGLVDAGVNYLLPQVARRLARDESGDILGYDYWDLDALPFDANPARSPFFPQRHGTRTATLLLREAPQARLIPYRYPRPDMERMTGLIDHAAAQGVVIVNLSMGSNDRGDWQAFEDAARAHPDMLFVVSAGNNGRDIDAMPVYPAALELPNILSVTSSENDGTLAFGSNRGARSVDLLVPAERMRVTDFNGAAVSASGSSYAAVRIAALAARLLADHPEWRAAALKRAILERALPFPAQATSQVAHGFLPRPDRAEDLPPLTGRGGPASVTRRVITAGELYAGGDSAPDGHRIFRPVLAYFRDSGWSLDDIREHARTAAGILAGCNIHMPGVAVHELDGPSAYRYFHDAIARELVRRLALPKPAVYFVRDTLQVEAYDAEAIGRGNSAARPELRDTVWITEPTREPGIALAHELAHLLMDRGDHVDTPGNLMRAETAPSNTTLTQRQCRQIRDRGTENGLLVQPGD